MTEFEVGQKVYGEEYDLLPVGTEFKQDKALTSAWAVTGKGKFQYSGQDRIVGNTWRAIDYEYERMITYLPEPEGVLRIEHTLVGAEVGDKVWPLNMPPSESKWPATIEGLDVDLVNVITADGHLERIHPSSLTTTPVEPPVWSVVTTTDEFGNERSHHRNEYAWHSSDRVSRTWTEICGLGSPTLRNPNERISE